MRRNFFKSAAVALAGLFAGIAKKEDKIKTKEMKADGLGHASTFVPKKMHGSMEGIGGSGGTKKTNRNRYSHNAKVKKRKAQAAR